jgi:hypothetical protein
MTGAYSDQDIVCIFLAVHSGRVRDLQRFRSKPLSVSGTVVGQIQHDVRQLHAARLNGYRMWAVGAICSTKGLRY